MKWKREVSVNQQLVDENVLQQQDILIDEVLVNMENYINSQVVDVMQRPEVLGLSKYIFVNDLMKIAGEKMKTVDQEVREKLQKEYLENKQKTVSELMEMINQRNIENFKEKEQRKEDK